MNHPLLGDLRGQRLAVPDSDLGLSLSNSAILRPLSEDQGTQLFILENTPENQEAIKNGKFVPWTSTKSQGFNAGTNINVTINDLAGAGNAANALKDLQDYFKSDGVKNIVISLGHHQVVNTSIPNWTTSFSSNLGTAPITGQECTGFPNGYFRIRLADTNRYWMLYGSKSGDGDFFYLVPPSQITAEQLFYLNPKGELCNRGANVDIMSSTLVIADNRPPTLTWPNPWSHSLPTFSYSKETKLITVKFYSDPWISPQWPRPESEWKDKEFIIAAETPTQTRIHGFDEIARWASPHSKLAWTTRGGSQFPAKHTYNVGVQEKPDIVTPEDAKKMQWDIEQV
ncbi:hypothetical protein BDZ97DRAFT_1830751 [Flammula alnicola]|nr:hypothetical protein BDZ97DRAFT_1830751 [Flammula alnicola]